MIWLYFIASAVAATGVGLLFFTKRRQSGYFLCVMGLLGLGLYELLDGITLPNVALAMACFAVGLTGTILAARDERHEKNKEESNA